MINIKTIQFSELDERAEEIFEDVKKNGPMVVADDDEVVAVVMSFEDYQRIVGVVEERKRRFSKEKDG